MRSGHLAIAVEVEPAGEYGVPRIFPAWQDRGHSGAHWADANLQRAVTGYQRCVADLDTFNVCNCIQRPRLAVKGNAQIAGTGLLSPGAHCGKKHSGNPDHAIRFAHPSPPEARTV